MATAWASLERTHRNTVMPKGNIALGCVVQDGVTKLFRSATVGLGRSEHSGMAVEFNRGKRMVKIIQRHSDHEAVTSASCQYHLSSAA